MSFNASLFVNLCLHVAGQAAVAGRGARFGLGLMMLELMEVSQLVTPR